MGTLLNGLEGVVQEGRQSGWSPEITRVKLKEKLQYYVLDFIYNSSAYHHLIFYGGTCLRICFGLNRMSEDVDFETTRPLEKSLLAHDIEAHFKKRIQYDPIHIHLPGRGVTRVELRFPVLYQLNLSTHESENLIVKIEVNHIKNHYPMELKTISQDQLSFVVRHYDLPTLMAGKMLACLERVWEKKGVKVKGRDYYDLLWYMQKGVKPNGQRLADSSQKYTIEEAFRKIRKKAERISPADLLTDLRTLFENGDFPRRWAETFLEQFLSLYPNEKNSPSRGGLR